MLSFEEASNLISDAAGELEVTSREIEHAVGYVLSEDIMSPISVCPFRNSARDGFALCSEWIENSSSDNPVSLSIGTTLHAGDSLPSTLKEGQVAKIMTGAPVPGIFDTVVEFEDTTYNDCTVVFTGPSPIGANIRPPGEDIRQGQLLYSQGDRLGSFDIGILASIGLRNVLVIRKPTVMVACTGSELVSPGESLAEGQVYNSNQYTLGSLIKPFAGSLDFAPTLKDDTRALCNALNTSHDIVIMSGGVSAGERDLVIGAAESCGWSTIFHKVRIKPGKPVYFARKGKQLLFGLPGNPLSTAVTCAVFVIPALKKLAGYRHYQLSLTPSSLAPGTMRQSDRMLIWPGKIRECDQGTIAEFSGKESSAALSAVLGSDGLIFQDIPNGSGTTTPRISTVRWQQIFERQFLHEIKGLDNA